MDYGGTDKLPGTNTNTNPNPGNNGQAEDSNGWISGVVSRWARFWGGGF